MAILGLLVFLLMGCTSGQVQQKPSFLWIDASANFSSYASDADSIARDCARIAKMGFTDIVVDVRPTCGDVLFKSRVAPPLTKVPAWFNGEIGLKERTADFDYLQAFIDAGHKAGLKVHAGVNMMVGGWRMGSSFITGMIYDQPEKKDWCAVDLLPDGTLVNQADNFSVRGGCFLDPAHPQVQEFLLTMLEDLASYKGLDGIVMDRCRYDDYAMDAGYTEEARRQFDLGHRCCEYSYGLRSMSPTRFESMKICYLPGSDDPGNLPEGSDITVWMEPMEGMLCLALIVIAENGPSLPLALRCAYQSTRYSAGSIEKLLRLFSEALDELLPEE